MTRPLAVLIAVLVATPAHAGWKVPPVPPTKPGIPVACAGPAAAMNPFCGGGKPPVVKPAPAPVPAAPAPPVTAPAVPPAAPAAPTPAPEQPAPQQQASGSSNALGWYVMAGVGTFFWAVICAAERRDPEADPWFCPLKRGAGNWGPVDAPMPGEGAP